MFIKFSCEKKIFLSIDCAIISNNGDETPKIFEVGTTAIFKWNLNGVPRKRALYTIYHYKNKEKNKILQNDFDSNTGDNPMSFIKSNNNPFEENNLNRHLNLTNGNGDLNVMISNVQYNQGGVIILDILVAVTPIIREEVNSTLDVQGFFHLYFLYYNTL